MLNVIFTIVVKLVVMNLFGQITLTVGAVTSVFSGLLRPPAIRNHFFCQGFSVGWFFLLFWFHFFVCGFASGTTALLFSLDGYTILHKRLLLRLKVELVLPHHECFVV